MGNYVYFRLKSSPVEFNAYADYCRQRGREAASKASESDKKIISKTAIDNMAKEDWETNRLDIEALVDNLQMAKGTWLAEWVAGYFSNVFSK